MVVIILSSIIITQIKDAEAWYKNTSFKGRRRNITSKQIKVKETSEIIQLHTLIERGMILFWCLHGSFCLLSILRKFALGKFPLAYFTSSYITYIWRWQSTYINFLLLSTCLMKEIGGPNSDITQWGVLHLIGPHSCLFYLVLHQLNSKVQGVYVSFLLLSTCLTKQVGVPNVTWTVVYCAALCPTHHTHSWVQGHGCGTFNRTLYFTCAHLFV